MTLPPIGKKIFMSEKTGLLQVAVHALVFAVVLYALSRVTEGFQAKPAVSPATTVAATNTTTAAVKASKAGAAANTSLTAAAKSKTTAGATAAANAATAAAAAYTEAAAAANILATTATPAVAVVTVPVAAGVAAPVAAPVAATAVGTGVDSIGQQFSAWPSYFPPAPPALLSACFTKPQPNNACYQLTRLAFPQCPNSFDACFSQYM